MRILFALALALVIVVDVQADRQQPHPKAKASYQAPMPTTGPCVSNKTPGTRNGNQNANNNQNTNTNTVKVNVSGGSSSSSSSSSGSNGSNGTGTNGPSVTLSPTDSRQFSSQPSYNPTHSPQYYPGSSGYAAGPALADAPLAAAVEAPVAGAAPAALTLEVPNENAEVFLNDVKMPHAGLTRKFVTPPLSQPKVYHYTVRVTWPNEMGGAKTYTTQIELRAGDDILHAVPPEGGVGGKLSAPPMPRLGNAPAFNTPIAKNAPAVPDNMMSKLKLAKILLRDGLKEKGKAWLQEIIDKAPGTPAAIEAEGILTLLK